jgi:hypothetical protein
MEDEMKASAILLSVVLAGAVFAALPAGAKQDAGETKSSAAKKETKWQGKVVRILKDQSTIEIHGGAAPSEAARKIVYDSSTEWTKVGKPGQQEEVKEGSFVIALGKVDKDGNLHATRVDLRRPR